MSINELGKTFRAWLKKQRVCEVPFECLDAYHARCIMPNKVAAHITFLPYRSDVEVVEFRIQREATSSPSFLTHILLDDEWRARALCREMILALETIARRGATKVLVCHPSDELLGCKSSRFTEHLRTEAAQLSVAFEFDSGPIGKAFTQGDDYNAIMLMPELASFQQQLHRAHQAAAVFTLPAPLVAHAHARAAIRLLLEALGEVDTLSPRIPSVPESRVPSHEGTILVLNVMYCDRMVRMGWFVYEGMKQIAGGKITKTTLGLKDIYELVDTLFLYGVAKSELSAIEILVPGIINFCSSNLPSLGDRDLCLVDKLSEHYGIPVYLDNDTNAAAMGCYLLHEEFESVSVYRHQLGHMNGGQGTVLGGHLVSGRYGMAGEPKFYQRMFQYDRPYNELVWDEKGLAEICKNVALATVGTIEPDALFMAVSTLEDIESLRHSIGLSLPQYCMPELVLIDDYRARMYVGGVGLCLKRLAGEA